MNAVSRVGFSKAPSIAANSSSVRPLWWCGRAGGCELTGRRFYLAMRLNTCDCRRIYNIKARAFRLPRQSSSVPTPGRA